MLCITEKLQKSSVKQPLGASTNSFLFVNAVLHAPSIVKELYQALKNAIPVSIRAYVDEFMWAWKTPEF